MPVSWQTRFRSLSATSTFFRIVASTRFPGTDVSRREASARASRRSCGMSFSAQTYRCAAASSTAPATSTSSVDIDRDHVGVELDRGATLLVRTEAGPLRAAERDVHLGAGSLGVD